MKRKDDKYLTPLKTIGGTDANMIAQGKLYEVWINKLHPEKGRKAAAARKRNKKKRTTRRKK